MFRWARESLEDDLRLGGLVIVKTQEIIDLVEQLVLRNRNVNAQTLAIESRHFSHKKSDQGAQLLHDDAPVHTAAISKAAIRECALLSWTSPSSVQILHPVSTSYSHNYRLH